MYKKFANSSIKHKILLMSMFLCMATILIMAFALVAVSFKEVRRNIVDQLFILETIIGKRSKTALIYTQYHKVKENIDDLQSLSYVLRGCIYDKNLELRAEYTKSGEVASCSLNGKNYPFNIQPIFGWNNVELSMPILAEDDVVGYIYVQGDFSKLRKQCIDIILNALVIMMIALIVAWVFSNHLQKLIGEPIIRLEKFARNVADGNYNLRMSALYHDEVGSLTQEFNLMLRAIKERDEKLHMLNSQLDMQVQERTKDLEFTVQRLQKANDMKKLWIQNIGHELRTPIHTVISFTEIGEKYLERSPLAVEKIATSYQRIGKAGHRLLLLINDLLDFGRLEAGKASFIFKDTALREIIDTTIEEISILSRQKNITIAATGSEEYRLFCDENRIAQVLTNILANAIKFSPENSLITLSVSRSSLVKSPNQPVESLEIRVIDQGIGIPENELDSIFDTFVQSTKTADGSGGTGLGLAISREIINAHNGIIWAKNNTDKGVSFIINIPVRQPEPQEENL